VTETFIHKPWKVAAIQWTGDNFADVEQFARDWIGDPDEIGLRNDGEDNEDNVVQFYAWNDDQEVDPERWIVVHQGAEHGGEIMHPDEFRMAYDAAT
jgi:hypothetical protein